MKSSECRIGIKVFVGQDGEIKSSPVRTSITIFYRRDGCVETELYVFGGAQ